MKWEGREESSNVEDRRGMAMPVGGFAGGSVMFLVLSMLISYLLGCNPLQLLEQAGEQPGMPESASPLAPENDQDLKLKKFVSVVMKDTEDVWSKIFREQLNARYEEPKLVLFSGSVRSRCGEATAAVGPFYCPGDHNVYLDLDFFRTLSKELGAPGDFPMAYVIAHEVGHHVQNLLGLSAKVQQMQSRAGEDERNQISVRLELQADYLAGVWAHHAQKLKGILERDDIAEALNAAKQIGDDTLQKKAGRPVKVHAFTHGSAQQRVKWYTAGLKSGDVEGMMKLFELPYEQL